MGAALPASWNLIVAMPAVVGVVVEKDIVKEESESDEEEYIGEAGIRGEGTRGG